MLLTSKLHIKLVVGCQELSASSALELAPLYLECHVHAHPHGLGEPEKQKSRIELLLNLI